MIRTISMLVAMASLWLGSVASGQAPPPPTAGAFLNVDALAAGSNAMLAVRVTIPKGFHAQSHEPLEANLIRFDLAMGPVDGIAFGAPIYPPGIIENYPNLGRVSVYTDVATVFVPLTIQAGAAVGSRTISGSIQYQMCDDTTCFRPGNLSFSMDTNVIMTGMNMTNIHPDIFPAMGPAAVPESATIWVWFGLAFLAGIIFNAMPCVLPVLPLKAMGFYEVSQHHRAKTIALAGVFSLGIVTVFGVLALLIFVFKKLSWGEQFANPWFAWGMVALLGVMGLGMFGAFTVGLPQGVYRFSPRHDTFTGNYLFGILAALLSTPCTAPLFPGLIAWAVLLSQLVGVVIMLIVGIGMSFPYMVLSAFPELARKFPRIGPWSELLKQMMGFLLIGAAVFFAAGRLMSFEAMWWPLVPVAGVAGLYLMARTVPLTKNALPVAISAVLAVAMVGGTVWAAAWMSGLTQRGDAGGTGIQWRAYDPAELEAAVAAGRPALVDFTANWCLNCKTVDATVFRKPSIIKALRDKQVAVFRADLTDDGAPGWALLKKLNPSGGIPLTVVYVPGRVEPIQLASIYAPSALEAVLEDIAVGRDEGAGAKEVSVGVAGGVAR